MTLSTRGGRRNKMGRLAVLPILAGLFLGGCNEKSDSEGSPTPSPGMTTPATTPATTMAPTMAPLVQNTQAELAQMFASATQVLASVNTSAGFAEIKPVNDVTLEAQGNALKIQAVGSDPAILLPLFQSDRSIAEINIESPADTTLQLFYRLPGMDAYSETASITVPIKTGKNVVYLRLPAAKGVLRLDPGQVPGDYLLESIQVKRAP